MILLYILFLICFIILRYSIPNSVDDDDAFTCGVTEIEERAIGLKKSIFKPGETVYLNFVNKTDEKKILDILKKEAFPYINLNFKLGNKQPQISIQTNAPKKSAAVSGNTQGVGTREPKISLWTLKQGTVLHEFGHALGLKHEQTNPSPNNEIAWNVDTVLKKYKTKNWKESEIYKQIINRDTSNQALYTKWDSKSIMNYNITDPDLTKNKMKLFRGTEYSDGDKLWLKVKYGIKK